MPGKESEQTEKVGIEIIAAAKKATLNLLQHYEIEKMKALDKIVLDDLRQRKREYTKIIKKASSSILEKDKAVIDRLSIQSLHDDVKAFIKERNQNIKNNKFKASEVYDVTFKKYYMMNGIVPDFAANTQKDFENRFNDNLQSNIFNDIQKKIDTVSELNSKLLKLSTNNYDEFNTLVKNSKEKLSERRDSGGVTAKFWEKINAVLKKFGKTPLEVGVTGAQYLDSMHSIFKKHKRHQKKLEKEAQKKNTRQL